MRTRRDGTGLLYDILYRSRKGATKTRIRRELGLTFHRCEELIGFLLARGFLRTKSSGKRILKLVITADAMSYTIGSSFTGQNTFTGKNNNTAAGYFSVGMTFYNGRGPFTTTSSVTLFTITWKTVTYHPTVFFHIVTSTENSLGGTMLLNPDQSGQQFSTTDGYLGCDFIQGPSP